MQQRTSNLWRHACHRASHVLCTRFPLRVWVRVSVSRQGGGGGWSMPALSKAQPPCTQATAPAGAFACPDIRSWVADQTKSRRGKGNARRPNARRPRGRLRSRAFPRVHGRRHRACKVRRSGGRHAEAHTRKQIHVYGSDRTEAARSGSKSVTVTKDASHAALPVALRIRSCRGGCAEVARRLRCGRVVDVRRYLLP